MVIFIDESGIHSVSGHSTTAIVYVEIEKLKRKLKKILRDKDISIDKLKTVRKEISQPVCSLLML